MAGPTPELATPDALPTAQVGPDPAVCHCVWFGFTLCRILVKQMQNQDSQYDILFRTNHIQHKTFFFFQKQQTYL